MKAVGAVAQIFLFVSLFAGAGCEGGPGGRVRPGRVTDSDSNLLSGYMSYASAKVDIMPLTGFVRAGADEGALQIKAYVSLLDSFDCQIKSPGTFRFELYEYVPHSAELKGERIVIWPDVDLTEAAENNSYWQDYLRAYKFGLDFSAGRLPLRGLPAEPQSDRDYILQVTCLCPSGRRLSDDFVLKYTGRSQ